MSDYVRKFEIVISSSGDQAKDLAAFRTQCRERELTCFGTAALASAQGKTELSIGEKFDLLAQIQAELRAQFAWKGSADPA